METMKPASIMLLSLLLLAAALLVGPARATTSPVWTDATFADQLKAAGSTPVLVAFTAPWCGHCQSLAPEFAEAAKRLEGKAVLAKVDATADDSKDLAKTHSITGFPTLKYFPQGAQGEVLAYEGGRTAAGIVSWIAKQTGPVVQEIASAAAADEILTKIRVGAEDKDVDENGVKSALVLIASNEAAAQRTAFEHAAKGDETSRLYYATTPDSELAKTLIQRHKLDVAAPTIVVFRSFDPSNPVATSDAVNFENADKLTAFTQSSTEPPSDVTTLNEESFREMKKSGKPAVVMLYAPWCGYCREFKPKYEAMAAAYKARADSELLVARLDATVHETISEEEGVASYPTIKLYYKGMTALFKGGEHTSEGVSEWVEAKLRAKATRAASEAEATAAAKKQSPDVKTLVLVVKPENAGVAERAAFEANADLSVIAVVSETAEEKATMYTEGEPTSTYQGKPADDGFARWKDRAVIPACFRFTDDMFDQIVQAKAKIMTLLFVENTPSAHVDSLTAFAKTQTSDVETVFSYALEEDDYLLDFFGLKKSDLPTVRFLDLVDPSELNSYIGSSGDEALSKPHAWEEMLAEYRAGMLDRYVHADEAGEEEEEDEEEAAEAEGAETEEGAESEEKAEEEEKEQEEEDEEEDGDDEEEDDFDEEDVDPDAEDEEDEEDAEEDDGQLPDQNAYEEAQPEGGNESDEL